MTVVVTGFTAARMLEMEDATIIDGNIVGNDLVLVTKDGTQINAGNVRGPQGIPGPGYIICTSSTRPSSPAEGTGIYETDTDLVRVWNGIRWRCQEVIICTSSTRPSLSATDEGVRIYETDTNNKFHWSGTAWVSPEPRGLKIQRQRTGDSPDITGAATVIDGYTVTLAAEANRVYEVSLSPRIVGDANLDQCTVRLRVDGVNYGGSQGVNCLIAGQPFGGTLTWLLNGLTAGNKVISITIQLNSGTAVHTADAGEISIKDIGGI